MSGAAVKKRQPAKAARLSEIIKEIDERMNSAWGACTEDWEERLCNAISMAVVDARIVLKEREES
jgi:hypothetical protein